MEGEEDRRVGSERGCPSSSIQGAEIDSDEETQLEIAVVNACWLLTLQDGAEWCQ